MRQWQRTWNTLTAAAARSAAYRKRRARASEPCPTDGELGLLLHRRSAHDRMALRVARHALYCDLCAVRVSLYRASDELTLRLPAAGPRRSRSRLWHSARVAGLCLMGAGGLLVLIHAVEPIAEEPALPVVDARLTPIRTAGPGGRVTEAQIRLQSERPLYVAVLRLDADGIEIVYPDDPSQMAPVPSGQDVVLPSTTKAFPVVASESQTPVYYLVPAARAPPDWRLFIETTRRWLQKKAPGGEDQSSELGETLWHRLRARFPGTRMLGIEG